MDTQRAKSKRVKKPTTVMYLKDSGSVVRPVTTLSKSRNSHVC